MNLKDKKFWAEILDLHESMPCLWKIKSSDYCNREFKSNCYSIMVDKLEEIDPDANREQFTIAINIIDKSFL